MRKYLVFLLFVLMLPLTIHAQTKKINRLKVERTVMQKKINESEQLLNTTKKDVRSQLNNLFVLNTQIGEQQKYVEGIQNEMVVLTNNLSVLEKELSVLQQELNIVKQKYHRAVLYTFRNKLLNNKWLFILNARSFNDMYRRMRYVNNYSKYQKVQGEIIREKEEAIQKKKNQILGIKTEKNQLLVEGRQQQQALHGKRVQQQQVVNELNQKQKELQTSIAQQRQKYASLNAQIDRLIQAEIAAAARRRAAEEAARKAAAEKARKAAAEAAARKKKQEEEARRAAAAKAAAAKAAEAKKAAEKAAAEAKAAAAKAAAAKTAAAKKAAAEKAQQARAAAQAAATKAAEAKKAEAAKNAPNRYDTPEPTPTFSAADNMDRAISGGFAANRGRLPMPITGSFAVTARYGSYNVNGLNGIQLDNKGINITGHPGAQARAVYRGQVTSIFSLGGMYNVIVRHGEYMTVYCNLSSVSVHNGQQVNGGQTLGAVAPDGSGNCTLHFQIRKETATLNPQAWLR